IETEDKVLHSANVTGKKLWLGRSAPSPYLDLGLPRYFLTLDKERQVLLGNADSETKNAVKFGEDVVCVGSNGERITLKLYDQEPRPPKGLEPSGRTGPLPGEMGKI
ncbi:MAG: hypothetical protein D4R73_03650, partial [Deltaproteobacteria bacterium]